MAAAAHNPGFAKKVGVPQSVATEFNQADKGRGIIKPKAVRSGDGHKLGGKMHPQDSRRGIGHNYDTDMKGGGSGYDDSDGY